MLNARTEDFGFERLLEELDAIAYPPVPVIAYHCDPRERWIKSEAEMRIEKRYEKNKRGASAHLRQEFGIPAALEGYF